MNKSFHPKRGLAVKVQNIVDVDVDVLVISANPSLLSGRVAQESSRGSQGLS